MSALVGIPHITASVLVGSLLLALGLLLYLAAVLRATLRVRHQYSRAMPGDASMILGSALRAVIRYSPLLVLPIAGAIVLYSAR